MINEEKHEDNVNMSQIFSNAVKAMRIRGYIISSEVDLKKITSKVYKLHI